MVPSHGQISALVALITDASKIVEEHYAKSAVPVVPSLDDTEPHPLDNEIYDKDLRNAIQIIEGACLQLSTTVARPNHTLVNRLMGGYEPTCLNVALTYKFSDILQEKPAGMHISEIGQKSGVEPRKAGRVLRILASKHIFREVSTNVFANNRLSAKLLASNPISSLGLFFTEECLKSGVLLSDTFGDPKWGHSYAPKHSAFNKYTGYPDSFFNFYAQSTPEAARLGARFAVTMLEWGAVTEANAVVNEFPWKDLGHGASVCDVGGGLGNIIVQLAKTYPTLQLILQDRPERILMAKNEFWPKECPEAIEEKRIQFKPMDFFRESPVHGCNIYYLKNIIHDWPDVDCIQILKGIREAMAPYSRVLVQEYILEEANRVPEELSSIKQAPEPLLPNYGAGRIRQYNLDLTVMVLVNGEERRLEGFRRLGEAAGLQFEKLWDLGEMGLVEYRLPA